MSDCPPTRVDEMKALILSARGHLDQAWEHLDVPLTGHSVDMHLSAAEDLIREARVICGDHPPCQTTR